MEQKKLTGYPSVDKPWLKYYTKEAINAPLPDCTIYEYMYNNNKDYPNDIALLYFNQKITYGKLFENIEKTAKAFSAIGVGKGDIVTVAMPSMPEALYCVYALNRLGAVANMIHPLASENEICHYLNEVKSTVFAMFTGTYELIKNAIGKTIVKKAIVVSPAQSLSDPVRLIYKLKTKEPKFGGDSVFQSWETFIKNGKYISANYINHDPNEMAVISHTGGTTGEPKGVMCSDKNINTVIYEVGCNLPHNRQEIIMAVLPPFINYSLVNSMLTQLVFGFKVVLMPQYEPDKFDSYIKKYHPNHINSIPPYWEALLTNERIKKTDLSCLRYVFYGGEEMDQRIEEDINELILSRGAKYRLNKGLGCTELISAATATCEKYNVMGSVGVPLVKINCKIIDHEAGDELPYNEDGEICFSGPQLMIGYFNNAEATEDIIKIHSDGERWMHTGDLGHLNEDGMLFVSGRIKRIIITKGKDGIATKLFPDRVEKVIHEHPSVALCCVIGIEDSIRVQYPKAVIVLKSGYEKSDAITNEILAVCKEKLPDYMVPEVIEYRDDLPRTSRGKVDYRALEKEAESTVCKG